MVPWIMALASVLGAKAQSGAAKKKAAADIMARNAQRLGGNTDMLDAVSAREAIDSQEGQTIGAGLAQSLVGRLGQQQPSATPRSGGGDQQALRNPNAYGDPEAQRRLSMLMRPW